MTTSDTAAALASALPALQPKGITTGLRTEDIAAIQADRLAEQGWVLVRPDDEATVERVGAAIFAEIQSYPHDPSDIRATGRITWGATKHDVARAALAALAARPGGADTEHAEVDRG